MCGTINAFMLLLVCGVSGANGYASSSTRNFQHSLTQQKNMQTVLNSIEERLRNLDKLYVYRHVNDENVRRLDALETRLERFESLLQQQFDKIEGNMSMQYFKDDIARDQVLRKIDAVYERMHHKMFHIEMKIDTGERKIMEKLEVMLQRSERFEDTLLTSRKSDIEFEVSGVLDAIEEMKTQVNAKMENLTKHLQHGIETVVLRSINETNEQIKHEIQTSKLDEKQPQQLPASIKKLESIVNSTRYEQQNAMRNLVVQVGRLGGKNNILAADCNYSNDHQSQQLTNISRKIDDKFDKIMEQQSHFLDSCHRIQSDEPQLESKISETLEKIIDVFSKESAIEIKDIQNIEQLIKSHDTTVRRSLYTTSHNMGVLLQKAGVHKDEIAEQVTMVKGSIDELTRKLNDEAPPNNSARCEQRIIATIQELRNDIGHNGSQVQVLLDDIRNVVHAFSENATEEHRSIDKNNIEIIREELQNVSLTLQKHMAVFHGKIERLLANYVDANRTDADIDLDQAIREIFSSAFRDENADKIVFEQELNCTSGLLDVRMRNTTNCTDDERLSFDNLTNVFNNSNETDIGNDDNDFDLRFLPDDIHSSTNITETEPATLNATRNVANQTATEILSLSNGNTHNDGNLHNDDSSDAHPPGGIEETLTKTLTLTKSLTNGHD